MKRTLSLLLIALLFLLPTLSAQAENGQYVYVDDAVLSSDELDTVNARAAEIAEAHGVGVYFFYHSDAQDLPEYTERFADAHAVEENALVLGINADYYHFVKRGERANALFSDAVCDDTLWQAFRNVKNDSPGKILAFLNAADAILSDAPAALPAEPAANMESSDPLDVPDTIARTDGGKPTLVDLEHLVDDADAARLSQRLKEIGSRYQCDVIVVTVPRLGTKSAEQYADDFFDLNGYGYGAVPDASGVTVDGDGILLLLSMEARDFAISTSGYGITAFTDYGIQSDLEPAFLPYLSDNDFTRGFYAFADGCEKLLKMAREEGMPLDSKHVYADEGALSDSELYYAADRIERAYLNDRIAMYFLQNSSVTDLDAYLDKFLAERVAESDVLILGVGADGSKLVRKGSYAAQQVRDKDLDAIRSDVAPYLDANNVSGALQAFLDRGEKVLSRRPLNPFALFAALAASGVLGAFPVSVMKKQLTSVSKQTSAEAYMAPNSYMMTQNSDVLLSKNVSRSVHVVASESSGGPRGGSGGSGGFHGGSSTHSSFSGGTHGGHYGKF